MKNFYTKRDWTFFIAGNAIIKHTTTFKTEFHLQNSDQSYIKDTFKSAYMYYP